MLRRKAQSKETKLYGASVMGGGGLELWPSMPALANSGIGGRKLDYWGKRPNSADMLSFSACSDTDGT